MTEKATARLLESKANLTQNILSTDEKMRVYHHNKIEKSSPIFANTKVTSCSGVLMSNGLSVAMAFKTGNQTSRIAPAHKTVEKLVSVTHD